MNGWAIGMIVLLLAELALQISRHGKEHEPYSAWRWLFGMSPYLVILYGGGFFN